MALRPINGERRNAAVRTATAAQLVERDAVVNALTRLAQIRDAASPTNPQVIQAVRDIASYLRATIKTVLGV